VIERALETAGLMLGSDKSRGRCLEMICADFLAGANLQDADPEALALSVRRLLGMLSPQQKQGILQEMAPCETRANTRYADSVRGASAKSLKARQLALPVLRSLGKSSSTSPHGA